MKKISTQQVKPAEGLCIQLPNGCPALQFISYKEISVETYVDECNKVRIIVDFDKPFINPIKQ